jgi:hypothetical protein
VETIVKDELQGEYLGPDVWEQTTSLNLGSLAAHTADESEVEKRKLALIKSGFNVKLRTETVLSDTAHSASEDSVREQLDVEPRSDSDSRKARKRDRAEKHVRVKSDEVTRVTRRRSLERSRDAAPFTEELHAHERYRYAPLGARTCAECYF